MEEPYLTEEKLNALIEHAEYSAVGELDDICVLTLHTGFRVVGISPGPLNPANYDHQVGQKIAYDKAFEQLWQLEAYRITAEAYAVKPIASITQDIANLPDGSGVFQIVNTTKDGQPNVDMQGVLIGAEQYDATNPAHRVLAVINNNLDMIVQQALGGAVQADDNVRERIDATAFMSKEERAVIDDVTKWIKGD